MADMKIPPSRIQPPAAAPGSARAEAVRAAQKAFFEAALRGTEAAPPKTTEPAKSASPAELQRYLRPGSRLDIKV